MTDKMRILTIIVSYNFVPWVDKCIGSVMTSEYSTDILVLDNGSKDDTVKILLDFFPQVKLIENNENLGFGKANNIGIQYAIEQGYDAVLLLNEDAWINPNTLERLVKVSNEHPEYGIISPVHLTGDGSKPEKGFSKYTGIYDINHLPDAEIVEVPFINAAIWFVRVQVLKNIGLFAPIFYHYGEDKDLVNRMAFYHYKIGYIPAVFAYHDRESRQITREGFFKSEYVYHLSEYTNINYSFGKAFCLVVSAILKKTCSSLFKGEWCNILAYISLGIKLLIKTPKIVEARKMSKHVELNNYKP
ncbi:glycosyltransferase family 2 protein [Prevotella sp. Rep29]|jgi:GT2 family glycosyltransferase|uniref:glycosyltransferase family 2 protein n=1 Tax=Prevotella sp. Rep29 TaxID=2691580 RepID=UPI002104B938|nr:glycosyltransferase family 2 protein [Prevotella sp. Rep29]